jgi:hypothetical protein
VPDNRTYVVKNITNKPCLTCSKKHEYFSRESQFARCGTPTGFKKDQAIKYAKFIGVDPDKAVILAPDNIVVVLDPAARRLKQQGGREVPMEQIMLQPRSV